MRAKHIAIGLVAAGLSVGIATPGFAQKSRGMAHKAIGSEGPGETGQLHRQLNQTLHPRNDVTGAVPGSRRSATGAAKSAGGKAMRSVR